ncbi:MAG: Uma2 family endonuclease [Lamprocystis purpurea]|jgi:Uma2 family endonuclease|uniref:Uma2 family endonuclease n=1 Tax=Lamprocystis purpurea TaxID=61598 RepID=UPI0003706E57|nr:Uma2 family endonuclease [Lamprocystis purpurea]MBV5275214.1 Uma2 family endonuclease [Lamprocystis purpurea]
MSSPALAQPAAHFTWTDYRSWPDDERWELIDGRAYAMSAAPSIKHQDVVGRLFSRMEQQLRGRPCRPFVAPTDVKFSESDVVQPDILVVCDPGKITPSHIEGAPDLIVEVLSPGTSAKDLRDKKALYERAGVREYLVVDPLEQYAIRFLLGADGYDKGVVFAADEALRLDLLGTVEIPLREVFEVPGPTAVEPTDFGPGL